MENGKDYIYEYSDLNKLYTRVKVLSGSYEGVIFEYGNTVLKQQQGVEGGDFTFDYIIYEKPDRLGTINLRNNKEFEKFITEIIVSVISDRRKDGREIFKVREAIFGCMSDLKRRSLININDSFYQRT